MKKDFDGWNKKKKDLHAGTFSDFVHEREVWWCAVGANIGVEADGKHDNFERPILVLRKFNKDSVLIVPLTLQPKDNPYHIVAEHNGEKFAAVISQMRMISTKRLLRLVYKMDSDIFFRIQTAVSEMVVSQRNRPPLARGPRWPHGHK